MTAIILPRRHIEQPQGAIEVDWAHPLAQGLSFIHHAGLGPVFLLRESTEFNPVAENGGAYSLAYDRYQHGAYAGSNYLQLSNMPALLPTFTAAKRAQTASLFAVARMGGSSESTMLSVSSNNANPLFRIVLLSSRIARFQVRPSGTTSTLGNADGNSTWTAGQYRVAIGVAAGITGGSTVEIHVDGRHEGSGDISLEDGYDQTWITEGVLRRTSTGQFMDGAIALSGGYSRPLDDAEIQALSENPWQLFKVRPQRIYFALGAGGGATSITTNVNALLQKQATITSDINAQLSKNFAATLDVDAVLTKGRTLIIDIDGYLQQRVLLTTDVDAVLGAFSTVVTQADAYLQRSVSILTDIDALLTAPQTAQTTVDSILQLKNEVTMNIDALLSKTRLVVAAADAVLLEAGVTAITTEVNALLTKMRNIAVTSDALLRKGFQTQTTIDSILQTRSAITAVINAVLLKTQLLTLAADSVLFDSEALGFQGTAGGFNLSQPSVNFAAGRSVSFGASRSFILDNPRGFRRSS